MTDMLEGMGKEIDEIAKIGGGLALLHSMLITDGRYTGSCFTVWDNARKALNEAAAALAAKDAEIAGLRDQLAFGRERTIDEKLDKLALKFAVAVAFEGIVLDPEKTERLREQIKKDAAKVYYLCAQPLYDKIAALAAKES